MGRNSYINNDFLSCSMESHISHTFADLFTSRPKAYSKKGLEKQLKLRLLKTNGINIKKFYLSKCRNINQKSPIEEQQNKYFYVKHTPKSNKYDFESEAKLPSKFNYLKSINSI